VEKSLAFRKAFRELENRIKLFVSLPLGSLDPAPTRAPGRDRPDQGPNNPCPTDRLRGVPSRRTSAT
jgi:hypothetical protein